ncbi:DUF5683 domain-containing protein [Gemmatimonadota bacterium]
MRPFHPLPALAFLMALGSCFVLPRGAVGQLPDSLQTPPAGEQEEASVLLVGPGQITPRGAFIRSAIIPGWGHAEVGSWVRGGFYFSVESAVAFMLVKTQGRLNRVRDRRELMESVVTARLQAVGITDPVILEGSVAGDPQVEELQALEDTRVEQREDWIALGVFFLFLGGADAYVSAHLADFPAAVEIEATPSGGVEVGLSIPIGH